MQPIMTYILSLSSLQNNFYRVTILCPPHDQNILLRTTEKTKNEIANCVKVMYVTENYPVSKNL